MITFFLQPELDNAEKVADSPVEGQSGRQIIEEKQHDDRHEVHHFFLGGIHGHRGHPLLNDHQGGHHQHQRIDGDGIDVQKRQGEAQRDAENGISRRQIFCPEE